MNYFSINISGTRPALLPMAASLTGLYLTLLESFYHCTNAASKDRPSASQLVQFYQDITPDTDHNTADDTILLSSDTSADTSAFDTDNSVLGVSSINDTSRDNTGNAREADDANESVQKERMSIPTSPVSK